MKLIKAPTAVKASKSPIINNINGEKLAICVFALAVKPAINPVGNSIINKKYDGGTFYYNPIKVFSKSLKLFWPYDQRL
jgi:hypothetical protein